LQRPACSRSILLGMFCWTKRGGRYITRLANCPGLSEWINLWYGLMGWLGSIHSKVFRRRMYSFGSSPWYMEVLLRQHTSFFKHIPHCSLILLVHFPYLLFPLKLLHLYVRGLILYTLGFVITKHGLYMRS